MEPILRCPNGHEWEPPGDPAGTSPCPTCGRPGAPLSASTDAAAVGMAATRELDPRLKSPLISAPATSQPKAYPQIVGYEILDELGRGGMGIVYRARQTSLNRTVALKMVLAGEYASERSRARFLGEAEIAAGLQHANIIQIHELGEDDGLPFISMEYVGGGGMPAWMEAHRGDFPAIAGFFEKLARAAEWAHQRSVVHRDLKPANVFLAEDGEPKIGDFGLAKRLDSDGSAPQLTLSGEKMGTPHYMAPEQAYEEFGPVGPGTDVYALGVMLYEAIAGRVPLTGITEAEMLRRLRMDDPSSPTHFAPGLPRDLETICLKCLRKHPRDRYLSAAAFADDLRRFLRGEPVLAKPLTAITRSFRWVRRHRTGLALTTLVAAFAVATGAWVLHGFLYRWDFATAYKEFTKHHGEYHGIGEPLTESEVSNRFLSYRIVRAGRKGHTRRLECIDSLGDATGNVEVSQLVPDILEGLPPHMQPAVFELTYDEDDLPSEERMFDTSGRLVARLRYAYPEGYTATGGSRSQVRADYLDEESRPLSSPSGVSSVLLLRDALGREEHIAYSDQEQRIKTDRNGVAVRRLEYDDSRDGRLLSLTNLDASTAVIDSKEGWASLRVASHLDASPPHFDTRFFDAGGNPAGNNGVHRVRTELDPHGNVIAIARFGTDGETPARLGGGTGSSAETITYDTRFRRATWTFSGLDPDKWGAVREIDTYTWNDDGSRTVSSRFEDADGEPARVYGQYRTLTTRYDSFGQPLEYVRDGYSGAYPYAREVETLEPAPHGGIARSTVAYQSKNGGLAYHAQGNSLYVREYDASGRLARVTLGGMDPTREPYEQAVIDTEWPVREQAASAYWNLGDALASSPQSAGQGNLGILAVAVNVLPSATRSAGQADQSHSASPGLSRGTSWSTARRERVAFGDKEEFPLRKVCRYLDADGKPIRCTSGNDGWTREYDPRGRPNEETHTGFDVTATGYTRAIIAYRYATDASENPASTHWRFSDASGSFVRHPQGYLEYSEEYNEAGQYSSVIQSGYDEALKGYFAKHWHYQRDAEGHIDAISETFTDANGLPTRHRNGHRERLRAFDAKDRQTSETFIDLDPATHSYHTQRVDFHYNDAGKLDRQTHTYTDADGNRVPSNSGYTDRLDTFDENERVVSIREWGFDPATFPYATEELTFTYDARGRKTSSTFTYTHADGTPARHPDGYHQYRESQDADGNSSQQSTSGFDLATRGYETETIDITRWPNGNYHVRHWRYSLADGTPARYAGGYSDFIQENAQDGSVLSVVESGFDPARSPYHLSRRLYAPHPNLPGGVVSTETYEDAAGQPARGEYGQRESIEILKDDRLLQVEIGGINEADRGFARRVTTYAEDNKVTSVTFTDAAGNPVSGARARVIHVDPGSNAERHGLRVGDYLLSRNGVPIESADHFTHNVPRDGGAIQVQREGQRLTLPDFDPGQLGIRVEDRVPIPGKS